ncbi:MAG: hypothetical protein OXF07_06970 [Rhodobacter sp.]|nr:hypothetical protein [Rhodobacter sp.]MCY4169646.1 hypothetical protein [Rhodobacter sp.]MCY4240971.1 hypothetical protein [Rhodobacter sp.]
MARGEVNSTGWWRALQRMPLGRDNGEPEGGIDLRAAEMIWILP